MDAKLSGGAGDELHALIGGWQVPSAETNDFAPINLGQLKNVAKPFYDRLIVSGIADTYPWLKSPDTSDNFALANIGQVKNLFGFSIPIANVADDARGDRLAAGNASANLALAAYSLWVWGDHFLAGTDFERNLPRRLTNLPQISSVTAGDRHLAVLAQDGTVWTWGDNSSGQLGDGSTTPHTLPSAVPGLAAVLSVKAGASHTLALRQDGTVAAWGENSFGQLGTGNTNSSAVPALTVGLDNIIKIAAGGHRSMALRMDGTVWIWGYDRNEPVLVYHSIPSMIPELRDVIDIAAGLNHAVALKSDGTVWAWGSNSQNQVANGNPWWKIQDVPFQVPGLPPIAKIASHDIHTLAIARDGTVWAWGSNANGQLGDGTADSRLTPVRVTGLTDVIAIATAYSYSLAMKTDGSVWAWGDGATGTLPGSDRHVPQLVGLGILDTNHNTIDDRWEVQYLGGLDQSGDADSDGDGLSNRIEYLRGTDPTDYYNGVTPIIEIAGGNNQVGEPGAFLAKPFKVRVTNATGQILARAPVTFRVYSGTGGVAATPGIAVAQSLLVRTDLNGEASAYHALSDVAGTSTRTTATAGKPGATSSVTFRGTAKFSPPPSPTPIPNPNSTPTPSPSATPSPTATPIAPYRYAVIDLGTDIYPIRINNNGTILVSGYDPDSVTGWRYGRWRGGTIEWLKYPDASYSASVVDINDKDIVVGSLSHYGAWPNDERELSAGVRWAANSSIGTKVSAPSSFPGFGPFTYYLSYRSASFTAINNRDNIFGDLCTGTVRGFLFGTIFVTNGGRWAGGSTSPEQLSHATGVNDDPDNLFYSSWTGYSDSISRASSDHYIGRRLTPNSQIWSFLSSDESAMIDGRPADFDPRDVNEHGIVVGNMPGNGPMVIRTLVSPPTGPVPDVQLPGTYPLAVNDHVRPVPTGQTSPTATPQPTPIPAPQVLSWTGNALALWELQPDGKTWHPFGLEEMIPSMDGWEFLDPYDLNDSGLIVGAAWHSDPSNPAAPGEYHGFLLVPIELMVDGNRDGQMSFDDPVVHDADQSTEEKPYRFWVNDDQDAGGGTTNSEEVTPPQLQDNRDEKIQSVRDCEDFARLWANIRGLTEAFKAGRVQLVVKFRNVVAGNPSVRAFRSVENGGRGYIANEGWGALQASPPFDQALPGTRGSGVATSTTGIYLDRRFWEGIDETNPVINLLFEGVEEGLGELYLEIIKEGRIIGSTPGVWMDIKNIKKMYERAKAQPENIVAPYTVPQAFAGPVDFVADPSGHPFAKPWDETDVCVVFVHGWNVSYDEYLGVAQTMFKRLWHQGFKGHFATFRWDTRKSDALFDTGEYNRSENRAYIYAAALKQWIHSLSNTYTTNLIAHSMGNVVCGEALRQGLQVRNYLLMEAAIPMSCYAPDAERLPRLEDQDQVYPTPDFHEDPTANEFTLGYRGYISSVAGNLINFYNEGDWALATGMTVGLETNWEKNQIDYKPDGAIPNVVHAGTWRYFYTPSEAVRQRALVDSSITRYVIDSSEMKAFVARSRTKAVGAFRGGGPLGATENLRDYGFQNGRPDHSGQFSRNIQAVDALYKRMRERLEE